MFAVTAILSCIIKIGGLFKSTKWRHFENVKFKALSARCVWPVSLGLWVTITFCLVPFIPLGVLREHSGFNRFPYSILNYENNLLDMKNYSYP